MNKFWSVLLFMVTVNSFANGTFVINGKVITEQGKPLVGVDIKVGERNVTTTQKGTFVIHANISDSYQIVLSHPKYFPSVQTFSHFELSQNSTNLKNISYFQSSSSCKQTQRNDSRRYVEYHKRNSFRVW